MIAAEVIGADFIQEQLQQFLPKEVNAIARRALVRIARILRDQIKSDAPVDTGELWQAIEAHRERGSRAEAVAAIWVTKGSAAAHDGWYWHFVEFGTVKKPANPFIIPATEQMRSSMPAELGAELMTQIAVQLKKRAKAKK